MSAPAAPLRARLTAVLAAASLLAASAPAALAQDEMSQEEFETTLSTMQDEARAAVDAYEAGQRDLALDHARNVTSEFNFEGDGASPLERAIKDASAVSIGDRVKALSSRLANAIEANESVERVQEVGDDLVPSLNRLVLVAEGKASPASDRQLKTAEGIEEARKEVMEQVNRSVSLYAAGEADEARSVAREAFFTYETNGLGPDTSAAGDEALENRAENLIVNFNRSSADDRPGLAGLIEEGAPLEEVQAQRDRIQSAMAEVAAVLKATLPPTSLGDANNDGDVTVVDALLVAQAALGVRESTDLMDANRDGQVTIVDALLVSQAALGIRTI